MTFANWSLWVVNGSIPLKDAIQYAQKNFPLCEEVLLLLIQRWSVTTNEDSEVIGQLLQLSFPKPILEKITSLELNYFCHIGVLDFIFGLPYFSKEFYHSLMLYCASRLQQKIYNDKYTTSLIHIIQRKHGDVDLNIKSPEGNSLLTYAIWRDKPELFKCLLHYRYHVEEKDLIMLDEKLEWYLPILLEEGIDLGKFPYLIHYWHKYLNQESLITLALQGGINYTTRYCGQTIREYSTNQLLINMINKHSE